MKAKPRSDEAICELMIYSDMIDRTIASSRRDGLLHWVSGGQLLVCVVVVRGHVSDGEGGLRGAARLTNGVAVRTHWEARTQIRQAEGSPPVPAESREQQLPQKLVLVYVELLPLAEEPELWGERHRPGHDRAKEGVSHESSLR